MIFTLVIPFAFMIFMSVSMDRVWSLYNTMQLMSNITEYQMLKIPANSLFFINIIKVTSNFDLLGEPNVQKWIQ